MLRVHHWMQKNPLVSIGSATMALNLTKSTVISSLERLRELHIVREVTGRQRNRIFAYDEYLAILTEGTERIS